MLSLLATATCDKSGDFFGFPYWYKYLDVDDVPITVGGEIVNGVRVGGTQVITCEVKDFTIEQIPLVGLALADIALRIAAFVAIGYIIYGGVQFILAQGESDKTKKARQTVINALIGLAIAIMSVGIVNFVGTKVAG